MCVSEKVFYKKMSIQPYVMETLYKHGTIDYVPYDLFTPFSTVGSAANLQQNIAGYNNNLQDPQMQELQSMSQAPITLYPKNRVVDKKINKNQNSSVKSSQLNYNNSDTFIASNSPLGAETGSLVNEIRGLKNNTIQVQNTTDSFRKSVISDEERRKTARPYANPNLWIKSLISVSAIALGVFALFKRGKATGTTGGSFWSKLNPLNWFK